MALNAIARTVLALGASLCSRYNPLEVCDSSSTTVLSLVRYKVGNGLRIRFLEDVWIRITRLIAYSIISKLTNEKATAIQQNQKLRQELDMLKRELSRKSSGGMSMYIVMLIGLLGILMGYFLKKT